MLVPQKSELLHLKLQASYAEYDFPETEARVTLVFKTKMMAPQIITI